MDGSKGVCLLWCGLRGEEVRDFWLGIFGCEGCVGGEESKGWLIRVLSVVR